jgi:Xaa-Pro aminopeptidase
MSAHPLSARHARVWSALESSSVDGLVVTSLANIQYLTGFRGSAGLLVVTAGRLYLLVDFRYSAAVASLVRDAIAPPNVDVIHIEGSAGYDRRFAALVAESGWRRLGFEAGHLPVSRWRSWTALLDPRAERSGETADLGLRTSGLPGPPEPSAGELTGIELVDTEQVIESVRVRKDPGEIAILREAAQRLSAVTHRVLDEVVRPGRTEHEVAADIDWQLKRAGFEKPAFDTIVASGPNSASPHARPTARQLEAGDLVVLDFGGVHEGYCVDLTRTVGIGRVSDERRRLYEAVAAAHRAAVTAAGLARVETGEVDAAARDTLREYGLHEQFGHGTGHGLGLDVHELPRLSRRTPENPGTDVLEAGMVFTIEPGAYVEGLGGVRIEDDLLRTADGAEMLTDVPRGWRVVAG